VPTRYCVLLLGNLDNQTVPRLPYSHCDLICPRFKFLDSWFTDIEVESGLDSCVESEPCARSIHTLEGMYLSIARVQEDG
jgi:hypothetical protein